MLFFEFNGCICSCDFKHFNQFVLKTSRCHPKQIINKNYDFYVDFGLVSAAVFTAGISIFSQVGSWVVLMGTQWGAGNIMRCSRHQSVGDAHEAGGVSCISQCQIVRLGNRPKSGMFDQ